MRLLFIALACLISVSVVGQTLIASGDHHMLALKDDGTVIAWGAEDYCNIPSGLNGVVSLAAGNTHSLALKDDGTVVAWGGNSEGQCDVPIGIKGVVSIAAGAYHSLALKDDGTVIAWGDNGQGQCNIPAGLRGVISVAGGGYYSIALKKNGTVVVWGSNKYGQCNVPVGLKDVKDIAGGYFHPLVLKNDGSVVAWGDNSEGQCDVPNGLNDVKELAGGFFHSVALKNNGTVIAWGDDNDGQCEITRWLNGVKSIGAGASRTLALKDDGTVIISGYQDGSYQVPSELSYDQKQQNIDVLEIPIRNNQSFIDYYNSLDMLSYLEENNRFFNQIVYGVPEVENCSDFKMTSVNDPDMLNKIKKAACIKSRSKDWKETAELLQQYNFNSKNSELIVDIDPFSKQKDISTEYVQFHFQEDADTQTRIWRGLKCKYISNIRSDRHYDILNDAYEGFDVILPKKVFDNQLLEQEEYASSRLIVYGSVYAWHPDYSINTDAQQKNVINKFINFKSKVKQGHITVKCILQNGHIIESAALFGEEGEVGMGIEIHLTNQDLIQIAKSKFTGMKLIDEIEKEVIGVWSLEQNTSIQNLIKKQTLAILNEIVHLHSFKLPSWYFTTQAKFNLIDQEDEKNDFEIQMVQNQSGTYEIPCEVNGLPLSFLFDTGASDVTLSAVEALFMYRHGYLLESDKIGTQQYMIANGDIVEGTTINIRELKIGDIVLKNVDASISHATNAPLLLGQSAISRLGTIQVDPNTHVLTIVK